MKYLLFVMLLGLFACQSSQKVYQTPAMGAEAEFDKGLRPEKRPQYLFDRKTMQGLQQQGVVSTYTATRHNTAPTAPVKKNNSAAAADSLKSKPDTISTVPPADTARVIPRNPA
ncbi:hypothetical protein ACDQ55_20045 [Chitinophaga sp. 30R24]|uniref:hypothetical protein n=1 Tax=Chitinophaga sp. 30R24 TaxID=3248838 RepID=UPI003B90360E